MRKILLLIIAAVLIVVAIFPSSGFSLSQPQKDTVNALGYPNQFAISYMPTGTEDSPTLTRNEVWYYPEFDMKIIFMGGDVFAVEEMKDQSADDAKPTELVPEDFHFDQSLRQINSKQSSKAEKIETYENDVANYASEEAFFTIEHGKLVFFQTLGFVYETEK